MKIISGGQTGVDRGALEAALDLGVPHGGWCPRGRKAEDGRIPDRFVLEETTSDKYPPRTAANVALGDGTLLLVYGLECLASSRGSKLTLKLCKKKPWWVADPRVEAHLERVLEWIEKWDQNPQRGRTSRVELSRNSRGIPEIRSCNYPADGTIRWRNYG